MNPVAILPDHRISYIDHLAPLCDLLQCPLLCTDPYIEALIQSYYPNIPTILAQPTDFVLDSALQEFDLFIYPDFYRRYPFGFQFAEFASSHQARSIYCLHGQSDKQFNTYWIEQAADEDLILIYGPKIQRLTEEKNLKHRLKKVIVGGNYRAQYYKKHKTFFDQKIEPWLFDKQERTTILYAPTWVMPERISERRQDDSSILSVYSYVLRDLPEHFQLLVKLHPYFVKEFPDQVVQLKKMAAACNRIQFIDDCPLIYPLLQQVDVYLGDYSSIGYDFLFFDRPLIFLPTTHHVPLHDCGVVIEKQEVPRLYTIIQKHLSEDQKPFRERRKRIYLDAFGEEKPWNFLKRELST